MTKGISCCCFILLFAFVGVCSVLYAQEVDESVLASGPPIFRNNETTIAVNPLDSDNVIAGAIDRRTDGACGAYVSFDGGQSWSQTIVGFGSDPAVTFDSFGNAYYVCLDHNFDPLKINVFRSRDGGRSWTASTVVSNPDCLDKPNITFDPTIESLDADGNPVNAVYVTWTCVIVASNWRIFFSRSLDGGETWSPGFQINESLRENQGSIPAVDNNGNIVVAWLNRSQSMLLMTIVDPDTQTTSGDLVITGEAIRQVPDPLVVEGRSQRYRTNSGPSIAFDRTAGPNRGRLYVVWAGLRDGDGAAIYETSTIDLGKTWQPPVVLNPNPPGNYVQIFPWISITGDGTALASFYDSQGDNSPIRKLRYWGSLFSGQIAATPPKFMITNPDTLWADASLPGGNFIGDYTGNTCAPDSPLLCYAAWMANATSSTQDVYVGRIRR